MHHHWRAPKASNHLLPMFNFPKFAIDIHIENNTIRIRIIRMLLERVIIDPKDVKRYLRRLLIFIQFVKFEDDMKGGRFYF